MIDLYEYMICEGNLVNKKYTAPNNVVFFF